MYITFYLKLNSRHHIGPKEFKEINWLPTQERVEHRVATILFKYWNGTSPFYVNKLFVPSRDIYKTGSYMALEIPLRKSNFGQKSISFMGSSTWNKLCNDLKILNTATSFTHDYKKQVLKKLEYVKITLIITSITIIITKTTFIIIIIATVTVITFSIFIFHYLCYCCHYCHYEYYYY